LIKLRTNLEINVKNVIKILSFMQIVQFIVTVLRN